MVAHTKRTSGLGSRSAEPGPGLLHLGDIEVADLGPCERLAYLGHPLFPRLVADQGDALDVEAVLGGKRDVVPQGAQVPAVKVLELGQQPDLAFFADGGLNERDERLVVLVVKLAGQPEGKYLLGRGGQLLDHFRLLLLGCHGSLARRTVRQPPGQPVGLHGAPAHTTKAQPANSNLSSSDTPWHQRASRAGQHANNILSASDTLWQTHGSSTLPESRRRVSPAL